MKPESIRIEATTQDLDVNDSVNIVVVCEPQDADLKDAKLIIKKANLLSGKYDNADSFSIKSNSTEGSTLIYIEAGDIKSNELTFTVVDKAAKAEAEKKAAAEKAATEKAAAEKAAAEQAAAEKAAAEKAAAEQAAAEQAAAEQAAIEAQEKAEQEAQQAAIASEPQEQMVWIAGSGNGKKYHSRSSCSNMSNPIEVTLSEAENRNYEPCKKCY